MEKTDTPQETPTWKTWVANALFLGSMIGALVLAYCLLNALNEGDASALESRLTLVIIPFLGATVIVLKLWKALVTKPLSLLSVAVQAVSLMIFAAAYYAVLIPILEQALSTVSEASPV